MDVDAALEFAEARVFVQTGEPFNDLQREIFKGAWQGLTYEKIADLLDYNDSYIKEEGARLCQLLSEALGEKVTKPKFRAPLERRWREQQSGNISSPHASVVNRLQPSATDPNFVGRESAIAELNTLVSQGAKVILIHAKGGVGKTTLARKYLQQQFSSYIEFPIAKETQNITSVESLMEERLKQLGEEPGREFGVSLDRLKRKLEAERIGVLIDNLEPALDGNGKFIEPHRRYVELLRVLANPEVQSVTLITSRECLRESAVTVRHYLLEGLDVAAWQEFFNSCQIYISSPTFARGVGRDLTSDERESSALSAMHKAYGGNAKAMEILSSAVQQDYGGNLEAYWQANQEYLLIERDLEDLVACQFNRLQQLNPDAYKLLCRMGCYRYQDVPTVPEEGLFCMLWDVPEAQLRRVVKSLRDRSLVEFRNGEYWLHPVIRAEARERLKSSEDWETANHMAAEFWTEGVNTVETKKDALRALEAYYHYVDINAFEQACEVIVKERNSRWEWSEALSISFDRLSLSQQMISAINLRLDDIIANISSRQALSEFYDTLGDMYWDSAIHKAIKYYEKSGAIADELDFNDYKILCSFNIGLCKIAIGELEEAVKLFHKAKSLSQNLNYCRYVLYSCFCLAFLNSCLGYKQEAFYLAEIVKKEISKISMTSWGLGYSLLFLGMTYKNIENTDNSFEMYHRAISFAEDTHYTQVKAKALYGLAELYREQEDFEAALSNHLEAIKLLEKIGAKCDLAEAYYQLGLTYQKRSDAQKSQENFDEAIRLFREMGAPKQVEKVRRAMENGG